MYLVREEKTSRVVVRLLVEDAIELVFGGTEVDIWCSLCHSHEIRMVKIGPATGKKGRKVGYAWVMKFQNYKFRL